MAYNHPLTHYQVLEKVTWRAIRAVIGKTRTTSIYLYPLRHRPELADYRLRGSFVLRSLAMNQNSNNIDTTKTERIIVHRAQILKLARKLFFYLAMLGPKNITSPKFIYENKLENSVGNDLQLFKLPKSMAINEYGLQIRSCPSQNFE